MRIFSFRGNLFRRETKQFWQSCRPWKHIHLRKRSTCNNVEATSLPFVNNNKTYIQPMCNEPWWNTKIIQSISIPSWTSVLNMKTFRSRQVLHLHLYTTIIRPQRSHSLISITKTCLYTFYSLKPHFYIVKLVYRGTLYFSYFCSKHRLRYSLEPPRRGGSNKYPQSMFGAEIWKVSEFFLSENFQFLDVKYPMYLNRRVFLMGRLLIANCLKMWLCSFVFNVETV